MGYPLTRLRRLRSSATLRRMIRETRLEPSHLIAPAFVVPGRGVSQDIPSMPGVARYSIDVLVETARELWSEGICAMLLFGVPEAAAKDERASGAMDDGGLVPRAVRALKDAVPEMIVITDVCLCAYTSHGHCGLVGDDGRIHNDESVASIARMALAHARAGADMVAPSDMMDGRVAAIRGLLDAENFHDTVIMSYAAKFASSLYGPFRDAAQSAPAFGDRRTHQLDPANAREALGEVRLDVEEGADIVMIKPALAYLDIIARVRQEHHVPVAAYQVSGEYAMIKAAAQRGWLDEERVVAETVGAIRRAGADLIITYFARDLARML